MTTAELLVRAQQRIVAGEIPEPDNHSLDFAVGLVARQEALVKLFDIIHRATDRPVQGHMPLTKSKALQYLDEIAKYRYLIDAAADATNPPPST